MIKLSQALVAQLVTSVTNNSSVERSDKELFLLAYKEYKGTDKKSRGHITNLLNVEVLTLTKSINVQNTLKRVFKLAFNYVDMNVICKFDSLEYTNISKLVKLFKYVDTNLQDKATELRVAIMAVYEKDMSPYRYNNAVADKIVELKTEYMQGVVETEEGFVLVDYMSTVTSGLSKLNELQLLELLGLVQAQYDSVETIDSQQDGVSLDEAA